MLPGVYGCFVDGADGVAGFFAEGFAGFELGRDLDGFAGEGANLYGDGAVRRLDGLEGSLEFHALDAIHANAEGGGLAEDQFGDFAHGILFAKGGELKARPVLFHLNGSEENIDGARLEKLLGNGADDLRGEIVDVGLHAGDRVALVAVGGHRMPYGFAQYGAQDVGTVFEDVGADAVADFFDLERGHGAEGPGELGDDGCAGGGDEFERLVDRAERDARQDLKRGRRGDGKTAVRGVDPAAALDERGDDNVVDLELLDADARQDDIRDGVEGADFVECDFVGGHAVDPGFGFCDALEDADGVEFYEVGEIAVLDEVADLAEAAAMVMMPFVLGMMVVFFMVIMMLMFVVLVLVEVMMVVMVVGMGRAFVDGKLYAFDILAHGALPMGVEIADVQFA